MAKKGLGRGLGAIFGDDTVQTAQAHKTNTHSRHVMGVKETPSELTSDVSRETSTVRMSLIEPNTDQPRKNFNEESLAELADSIKEHGVLQPIIIRKKGRMYEIVVGERRWRAAKMAGLKEIPAIVRDFDERERAEIALIENIQRENLSSVEEARAYRSLIDDYGLTQEELANRVSKNRTTITNSLRLLQLDNEVLDLIESGELSAGHARTLLGISGKRAQYKAAREVVNNRLSVRETEKLVKEYNREKKTRAAGRDNKFSESEIYIDALSKELTELLNTRVTIRQTGKEKGRVEIEYYTADGLDSIIEKLR